MPRKRRPPTAARSLSCPSRPTHWSAWRRPRPPATRPAEAEQTLRRAIAVAAALCRRPDRVRQLSFTHGRSAEAVVPYQRATVLEPDNPNAFNNLGAAYLYLGDFDKAAAAFHPLARSRAAARGYSNTGMVQYYRGSVPRGGRTVSQGDRTCARRSPSVGQPRRRAPVRRPAGRGTGGAMPRALHSSRASSPSTRNMPSTRRRRRTMQAGSETGTGPDSA